MRIPHSHPVLGDAALERLIASADRALLGKCSHFESLAFLEAMPELLRELRDHRRAAALPATILAFPSPLRPPANDFHDDGGTAA